MKNIIIYLMIILSYIFLLSFSSLSGVQSRSNIFYSYLGGEILFDYDSHMSLFHHYYSKISRFTENRSKFDFLLPTIDSNNNQLLPAMSNDKFLMRLNVNDSQLNWTTNDKIVFDNQELQEFELLAELSSHRESTESSYLYGDNEIKKKEKSSSMITSPCGMCNNFPILFSDISHLLDYSVEKSNGGFSLPSGEGFYSACSPTPEPDTIFLFGSVLLGFIISNKIIRRKK